MSGFKSPHSHSLDVDIALKVGHVGALVYNHLKYWIIHNRINGVNLIEGRTWTFQSYEKMQKYLPYLSVKEIRASMQRLVVTGLVIRGEFNKNKFDHTTWYALTEFDLPKIPEPAAGPNDSNSSYESDEKADRSVNDEEKDIQKENTKVTKGQIEQPYRADPSIYNKTGKNTGNINTPRAKARSNVGVPKIHFREFVSLEQSEYDKLLADHGQTFLDQMLDILNSYKGSHGKTYKSDYLTMSGGGWVLKRAKEEKAPAKPRYEEKKTATQKYNDMIPSAVNGNLEARLAMGGSAITRWGYNRISAKADRENRPEDKLGYLVEEPGGGVTRT